MWVLKRQGDGKFVAKGGMKSSYTYHIKSAKKFASEKEARENSCPENEYPVRINAMEEIR